MRRALFPFLPAILLAASLSFAKGDDPLGPRLDRALQPWLQNGSVVVADEHRILYSHRGREMFIPASTLKLTTALAAIHYLGADYRFRTEFYLSDEQDITVRGMGDPFLISEEWEIISRKLNETGKLPKEIRNIYLDASAFAPNIHIPGVNDSLNPYDALNGALAANFNTLYVRIHPDGSVTSAEPQTPVVPLALELSSGLEPGDRRINVSMKPETALLYVGQLFRAFLQQHGHAVTGKIEAREVAGGDRLIYEHKNSRSLREVIQSMMLYSSNFIANQMLLTLALEQGGKPATLERGVSILTGFLSSELNIPSSDFRLVEGSGISRDNLFRPEAYIVLLRAFHPYRSLLNLHEDRFVKTGTLNGVYSLVGYLDRERPVCFVIMLNQPKNYRDKIFSTLLRESGLAGP